MEQLKATQKMEVERSQAENADLQKQLKEAHAERVMADLFAKMHMEVMTEYVGDMDRLLGEFLETSNKENEEHKLIGNLPPYSFAPTY